MDKTYKVYTDLMAYYHTLNFNELKQLINSYTNINKNTESFNDLINELKKRFNVEYDKTLNKYTITINNDEFVEIKL